MLDHVGDMLAPSGLKLAPRWLKIALCWLKLVPRRPKWLLKAFQVLQDEASMGCSGRVCFLATPESTFARKQTCPKQNAYQWVQKWWTMTFMYMCAATCQDVWRLQHVCSIWYMHLHVAWSGHSIYHAFTMHLTCSIIIWSYKSQFFWPLSFFFGRALKFLGRYHFFGRALKFLGRSQSFESLSRFFGRLILRAQLWLETIVYTFTIS